MVIGVCTVDLYLPTTHSLKDKRRIIKSAVERIRSRFNVSVAEVEHQDRWGQAQIAMAAVSNETAHVQQVLNAAVKVFDNYSEAEVTQVSFEMR
ncbi:MAG: DUF503 domain-containing protein [Firmicutes bacterium]|nr:DUF503 domain-containing protein [Bacillota bacterium]